MWSHPEQQGERESYCRQGRGSAYSVVTTWFSPSKSDYQTAKWIQFKKTKQYTKPVAFLCTNSEAAEQKGKKKKQESRKQSPLPKQKARNKDSNNSPLEAHRVTEPYLTGTRPLPYPRHYTIKSKSKSKPLRPPSSQGSGLLYTMLITNHGIHNNGDYTPPWKKDSAERLVGSKCWQSVHTIKADLESMQCLPK